MSWWVSLENENGDVVTVKSHTEGGTHVIGGTTAATLNVTYNYGKLHSKAGCHLSDLDGLLGSDAIPRLEAAVKLLGTFRDDSDEYDYWEATAGNAGYALSILLQWARQYPDAIFRVS